MSLTDAQTEASEAAADALEQAWESDRTYATLAEALAADGPDIAATPEARQAWHIDGDNTAGWALRKLAEQRAEIDRIDRLADDEVNRVKRWAEDAKRGPENAAAFFTSKLIDYRRRLEADNPKLPKTYKLPAGDLVVRAGRTSTRVVDEPSFVEWAATHAPEALSRKPLVSALADWVRAPDGRIVSPEGCEVPGVEAVTGDPTYTVKPSIVEEPF